MSFEIAQQQFDSETPEDRYLSLYGSASCVDDEDLDDFDDREEER